MKFVNMLLVVMLAFFAQGCSHKDSDRGQKDAASTSPLPSSPMVGEFLLALKNKDRSRLVSVVLDTGVFVVRDFTTGTYGARGESLYQVFSAKNITDKLHFPVENQVPVNIAGLFPEAADQDFAKIAIYTAELPALLPNEENAALWLQKLKEGLQSRFEREQGIPLLLVSADSHLVVLCEAQIIDDTLVGSFAVFVEHAEHNGLGALIDLL